MAKTVQEVIEKDPKELSFEERAARYQEEIKPICEKWGITPWAGFQSTNEMIAAVPQLKDLFEAPKND